MRLGKLTWFKLLFFFLSFLFLWRIERHTASSMLIAFAISATITRYGASKCKQSHITCLWWEPQLYLFQVIPKHKKISCRCQDIAIPFNPASLNASLATWLHDMTSSSPPTSAAASPYMKIIPDPTTASAQPSSRNFDLAFAKSVAVKAKNGPLRPQNKDLEGRWSAVFC